MHSTGGRMLIFSTALLLSKATKNTIGVSVMTLKKNAVLKMAYKYEEGMVDNPTKYRTKNIPIAGSFAKDFEPEQLSLFE